MMTIESMRAAQSAVLTMRGIVSHMIDTNPARQVLAKLNELDRLLAI